MLYVPPFIVILPSQIIPQSPVEVIFVFPSVIVISPYVLIPSASELILSTEFVIFTLSLHEMP